MSIVGIDTDYFKGQIDIPFDNFDDESFQTDYIDVYEKEVLIKLLGYDLYTRFKAGLEEATVDQKWTDLKEGADYDVEVSGIIYKSTWNGFVNDEMISLIAYYIYYKWLEKNNEQLTGTGVGIANKENATDFDKNKKLVQSWNLASQLAGCEGNTELDPTLYNFLKNFETDYEPIVFQELGYMNIMGF